MNVKQYIDEVVEDLKVNPKDDTDDTDDTDETELKRERDEDLEQSYRESQERDVLPVADGY